MGLRSVQAPRGVLVRHLGVFLLRRSAPKKAGVLPTILITIRPIPIFVVIAIAAMSVIGIANAFDGRVD